MNRKYFVMAALISVVLLTVAFIPISSQQVGTYDPWADINENGEIDVYDLAYSAKAFGTSGDPTKNVTIGGHATNVIKPARSVSVPNSTFWVSDYISVDGYSKVSVLIYLSTNQNVYILYASDNGGNANWVADRVNNFNGHFVKTYDVMNQRILIQVYNTSPSVAYLTVDVYIMA